MEQAIGKSGNLTLLIHLFVKSRWVSSDVGKTLKLSEVETRPGPCPSEYFQWMEGDNNCYKVKFLKELSDSVRLTTPPPDG